MHGEEEKHKNLVIAQQYKMRYYENEFPTEGELVMVHHHPHRDSQKSQKKTDATSHCSSTTTK